MEKENRLKEYIKAHRQGLKGFLVGAGSVIGTVLLAMAIYGVIGSLNKATQGKAFGDNEINFVNSGYNEAGETVYEDNGDSVLCTLLQSDPYVYVYDPTPENIAEVLVSGGMGTVYDSEYYSALVTSAQGTVQHNFLNIQFVNDDVWDVENGTYCSIALYISNPLNVPVAISCTVIDAGDIALGTWTGLGDGDNIEISVPATYPLYITDISAEVYPSEYVIDGPLYPSDSSSSNVSSTASGSSSSALPAWARGQFELPAEWNVASLFGVPSTLYSEAFPAGFSNGGNYQYVNIRTALGDDVVYPDFVEGEPVVINSGDNGVNAEAGGLPFFRWSVRLLPLTSNNYRTVEGGRYTYHLPPQAGQFRPSGWYFVERVYFGDTLVMQTPQVLNPETQDGIYYYTGIPVWVDDDYRHIVYGDTDTVKTGMSKRFPDKTSLDLLKMYSLAGNGGGSISGDTDGSTTYVLSNTFALIGQGLGAIGGFLAIAVFPGISLGMLFLVPIVVLLVLFVVGLFKR